MSWNQWGNGSLIDTIEGELPPESTFYWLLISIMAAITWLVYLTYYNSRILGLVLTAILNRIVKVGHVKFGSFSVSVLSGKVMFRDVHFITEDFSIRVQCGHFIFRWWRPLLKKEINEDMSHCETRLSVYLDTFEFHVYNRSHAFARLEKLFGLDVLMVPQPKEKEQTSSETTREVPSNQESKWQWRDLVPVIKLEISTGKVLFGNYLCPTTLSCNFGDAHIVYTTKPASTPFDLFMHIIKVKTDNLRIMLVPSPRYIGPLDEPPRFMGEGFVILQSNNVDMYYYHDEPGLVPYEPEQVQLANGDMIARRTWPCWGMDTKCGKGTDISYGPWADRQREFLWKFFFPADYQSLEETVLPSPGQRRIFRSFDFMMSMQHDATLDVLFTKSKETQAVHTNMRAGSYLEFSIPWLIEGTGFKSQINGQLLHLDATTSLPFRSFVECETLEFDIEVRYPKHWNEHQDWRVDFRACKAVVYFIFHHKIFLVDLIEDWSNKARPDIFHFIPYTWQVNLNMNEFELITITNEWNWIDCFGQTPENARIGFCGDMFDMTFHLPFVDFVPPMVPIKFFIRGETVDCRFYLPETNTSRHIVQALATNAKVVGRDGLPMEDVPAGGDEKRWRKVTQKSLGWIDCWTTHIVAISIGYTYHPIPPTGDDPHRPKDEPISTPEAEEQLLIPLRLVPLRPLRPKRNRVYTTPAEFDPTDLEPDLISVELEVGPSVLHVYGSILRNFLHVKENYFGEDQKFKDYEEVFSPAEKSSSFTHVSSAENPDQAFDARQYRPLHVNVQVTLHDILAHLVKNCNEDGPPCPCVHLERLGFEMDKRYRETKLQVLTSTAILVAKDYMERPDAHNHLKEGHLALSGLQVRGHGMFSQEGLPLDSETLEYSWMVEVTVGDITGRLTAPQLQNIVEFAQTFVFLVEDDENVLQHARPYRTCLHGLSQHECQAEPRLGFLCPTSDDIKYRLTRVSVDCIDLYLVDTGSALNLQVYPIRVSTCNLHGRSNKAGITALIPHFNIKQFILSTPISEDTYSNQTVIWLEAGGISLGPLNVDAAMALPSPEFHAIQDRFLKLHDKKTHRLWFLWPPDLSVMSAKVVGKCGCVGGSRFFGRNRNGPRFFHPSAQDFVDGVNAAVFHILTDCEERGYGQSLLQPDQRVFDVPSSAMPITPSKSKILKDKQNLVDSKMSVSTQKTSSTLVDEPRPSLLRYISDRSLGGSRISNLTSNLTSSERTLKDSGTLPSMSENQDKLSSGQSIGTGSVPSEYMPESPMPDAYDTDRCVSTPSDTAVTWVSGGSGSVASLPEAIAKKQFSHERKWSYDPKQCSTPSSVPSGSETVSLASPTSISLSSRRDSKSSLPSSIFSGTSRQSSLTSPVLRRLSSQVSMQDGSTASVTTGSERFFSAAEEFSDCTVTSDGETPRRKRSHYRQGSDTSYLSGTIDEETLTPQRMSENVTVLANMSDSDTESVTSFVSALSSQNTSVNTSLQDVCKTPSVPDVTKTPSPPCKSPALDVRHPTTETRPTFPSLRRTEGRPPPHPEVIRPKFPDQPPLPHQSSLPSYEEMDEDENAPLLPDAELHDIDIPLDGDPLYSDTPSAANYIDLHGQINKPITESPLLMSCYVNHLTQLHCSHWASPPPLPHLVKSPQDDAQASSSYHSRMSSTLGMDQTPAWIPQFAYHRQGFCPGVMVNKRELKTPPSLSSPSSTSDWDRSRPCGGATGIFAETLNEEPELGFTYEDHVSKTTAVVNLKGSVDVMISPLMLESLQRMVEAVTPTLAKLHPSAIVDELHFRCSSDVIAQNKLKKQASQTECPERKEGGRDNAGHKSDTSPGSGSTESDTKTSRLQVMVSLSRIKICVLQVSLVEEMIAFSAIDHVRELTCVSVLAICLDSITCQLLANNHSHRAIDAPSDSSPDSVNKKPPGDGKKKTETAAMVEDADGSVEMQQEEMVGNLHIGRIHFQLRRMKKNSSHSEKVFLTAIPEYRSKVLFTFQPTEPETPSVPGVRVSTSEYVQKETSAEDLAGFIMFEIGLEDISLKAAKRSGFQGNLAVDDEENMHRIDTLLHNIQQRTAFARGKDSGAGDAGRDSDTASIDPSHGSGHGNSADDEASSWHSRISMASQHTAADIDEAATPKELSGDASSCTLQFKTVWFNFAAPPPSPRKRRLEYTRHDWNLLSTATPAINAWMQPGHRLMVSIQVLMSQLKFRVNTILACIMTEALDSEKIHMPARSKYSKITSLSRTLQEDPSCQLLTVLRRYIRQVGVHLIEENMSVDTVPQLLTIQKGLLALTRQWKNILYMPILADSSFKNKKRVHPPLTVTFAMPTKEDSVHDFTEGEVMEDEGLQFESFEVVDEKTSLLRAEGGSIQHAESMASLRGDLDIPPPAELTRPASAIQLSPMVDESQKEGSCESIPQADSRTSASKFHTPGMATPYSSVDSPAKLTSASQRSQSLVPPNQTGNAERIKRNESNVSFASTSISMSSQEPGTGTPIHPSLMIQLSEIDKREDEDLYRWMQRQQEYTKSRNQGMLHYYPSMGQESFINTGLSEYSQDDSTSLQRMAVAHSFLQLADAQVLFKPLLASIGIHLGAVKSSAFMKKFGGNVSIQGILQTLRVDIVDSEFSSSHKKATKGKGRPRKLPKLHLDAALETPAFLCEGFSMTVGMKDIIDFEKESVENGPGSVDWRRKSLRAIKFAMDHMEAKPTTTKVHFSLNCNSVNQHVNMSLLRLVHQFVTMIENINETRVELSGQSVDYKTHRKQDSKGSSTGTESNEQAEMMKTGVSSPADVGTPTPDSTALSTGGSVATASTTKPAPSKPIPIAITPITNEQRPDKLPLFHTSSKSPKKFSLRKGKGEFFGMKTGSVESSTSADNKTSTSHVQSPPASLNLSDSVAIEMADTSSPIVAEKTIVDEIKENTPKCWRTLYHLLELYSTMPETKTVRRRPSASRLSVIEEENEKGSQTQSIPIPDSSSKMNSVNITGTSAGSSVPPDVEELERQPQAHPVQQRTFTGHTFTQSIFIRERIPLVVFGIAKVRRIHISAMLSELKLEADLQNVHASATHRERVKGVLKRKSRESSATAYVGHTMIVLLEGLPPNMQTVVTVNIAKSQGLYSSAMKRSKEHNSALVTVGKIDVDIPQHPVVLHDMVARSSRRLSSTLQEFMRPPAKTKSFDSVDGSMPSQASKHSELNEYMTLGQTPGGAAARPQKADEVPKPVIIHFKAVLQGLVIGASLLPSLRAQYKMGQVTSSGVTGKKARFTIDLPTHSLSFSSKKPQKRTAVTEKVSTPDAQVSTTPAPNGSNADISPLVAILRKRNVKKGTADVSTPSTLPSSASVDLPPIHLHADYRQHAGKLRSDGGLTEGLVLREGNYLNAVAEVGAFEHSLTTDLLNHLVFVQKVFMKEVNEVVQKVSGADQPVPLWEEGFSVNKMKDPPKPMLYSLLFRFTGMQITAMTPTSNAVRLETGSIELELSNRVQTASKDGTANKNLQPKLFLKAQVDLNLALGTLIKNALFEEAEPEFQHLASFATRIALRNALQDEMIPGMSKDQEALLISLNRPVVFVQPLAFDKAVLVWLNYKNAYEYWNEQRLALNKEVQTATQQVIDKLPLASIGAQASPALGTLFLQLTVDDLGICIPMDPFSQSGGTKMIDEPGSALVLTLESTLISACSCGSLVSKGKFRGFALRFANDFEVSWDDWKPDKSLDVVMNAMVVPEGTYEVCSQTINSHETNSNAKWILNVMWQMRGIDIHLDVNIGKCLSVLGSTLTSLTSVPQTEEEEGLQPSSDSEESEIEAVPASKMEARKIPLPEGLPEFVYDESLDPKTRARLIEKEMNEQAKVVQDLKQLGASMTTIESEQRKLQELEAAVFHDFRLDIMKKLKRQSVKANVIREKLGLGVKPAHIRSHSMGTTPAFLAATTPPKKGPRQDRRLISCRETDSENISPVNGNGHNRAYSVDFDVSRRRSDSTPAAGKRESPLPVEDDPFAPAFSHYPHPKVNLQDILASSSDSDAEADHEIAHIRKPLHRSRMGSASGSQPETPRIPSPSSGSSQSSHPVAGGQLEPNIDYEIDIKVNIDRGQCVLHPKEHRSAPPSADIDDSRSSRAKRDSRDLSPLPHRKRGGKKQSYDSGTRYQQHRNVIPQQSQIVVDNTTVFFLPGVDVRVHYNSKSNPSGVDSPTTATPRPVPSDTSAAPSFQRENASDDASNSVTKKVYAWLSLQQLSDEMLISPVLLDFLEQALEPIPMAAFPQYGRTTTKAEQTDGSGSSDLDTSASSLVSSGNYVYAAFPVDVVVYISVQPSLVRFSCLPVSRVECLLRLPSLDLVFSSKRAEESTAALPDTTPPMKAKRGKSMGSSHPSSSNLRAAGAPTRTRSHSGHSTTSEVTPQVYPGGGLSVTGCLADFSLFVFHPYGHGTKKTTLSALENSFKRAHSKHSAAGGAESIQSPLTDTGRKDSLSLNVEFVKVNISRSRKGIVQNEASIKPADFQARAANVVRFSAICDIGSAAFKYDMRRLSEILALPKAWYRRSLARRVFLGEESAANILDDSDIDDLSSSSSNASPESPLFSPFGRAQTTSSIHTSHLEEKEKPAVSTHRRVASEDRNVPVSLEFKRELDDLSRTPSGSGSTPQSPSDEKQKSATPSPTKPRSSTLESNHRLGESSRLKGYEHLTRTGSSFTTPVVPGKSTTTHDWETLVLFSVNLSQLDVGVNMSNVMGNTMWTTSDLKSQGRLSIHSSGYKKMKISAGLGRSKLESRGGIVGGNIELHRLTSSLSVREDPEHNPDHRLEFSLYTLETRLDYMGSSVLMGRFSMLTVSVSDEWVLDIHHLQEALLPTKRGATVFAKGDLTWDKIHLMISRSTTPDLLKMVSKLEEFFAQQLNSSKRVLSAFGPISSRKQTPRRKSSTDEASWISEIRHHRHWQRALEHVSGCKLAMFSFRLPEKGTILGGKISLNGNNLSLATFHGINFRSKSWALFTLDEPSICFDSEAQDVTDDDGRRATHVIQSLLFQLGGRQERVRDGPMATICKLSRGHYMPPPFTSVQDWFHYAFATSEIKDLDNFPYVIPMGAESPTDRPRPSSRKSAEYNHETEIIFALPSLEMLLKTEHLQGETEPLEDAHMKKMPILDPKPNVECSFVTNFEDHIFVAMDAEAILFLHDLVMNYVREKDRGARGSYTSNKSGASPELEKKSITDPTAALKEDYREFHCKTWHLEPTIRLLSWAGKRIEAVGVDFILQKLGFQHARLTIPKWMQRGAMDPLDKILSVLVDKLIILLRDSQAKQSKSNSR